MKFLVKRVLLVVGLITGGFLFSQTEFKIPPKPEKIYPVNDYLGILSSDQKKLLDDKLIAYSDSTSTQILVCLVNTLDGDDINFVGAKWGEEWQIGKKDKNNGILLLIAVKDRKLSIQTGRGTEDAMTDRNSSIIINQYMVPYLKSSDFYGAIQTGTDQIIKVLQGKFKADRKTEGDDDNSGFLVAVAIFLFILFIVFISNNNNNSNKNTYYDRNGRKKKDDDDFWGGLGGGFFGGGFGSGGFGGGSSGGGGFGGFGGGGSFGGGGASGSW